MNEWLNHPALKNMDPVKLELIKLAAKQTEGEKREITRPGHDVSDQQCPSKGNHFSPEEMSLFWKS